MFPAVTAAVAAGALLLAGCSDGAAKHAAEREPAHSSAAPAAHEVAIKDFLFSPTPLEVAVGSTITWTNEDSALHSVVAKPRELFASDDLTEGQTFEFNADKAGTVDYICGIHNYMVGQIVVG